MWIVGCAHWTYIWRCHGHHNFIVSLKLRNKYSFLLVYKSVENSVQFSQIEFTSHLDFTMMMQLWMHAIDTTLLGIYWNNCQEMLTCFNILGKCLHYKTDVRIGYLRTCANSGRFVAIMWKVTKEWNGNDI